jgi:chromosome segregation ATPase
MPRPIAVILLALAPIALAITPDEARRQADAARQFQQNADAAVASAAAATRKAQQDLELAITRQVQLPRLIDATQKSIVDLEAEITSANKLLPTLRAQLDQSRKDAAAAQTALIAAQKTHDTAQAAAAKAKSDLWKQIQSQPDYQSALAAQSDARQRFDAARQACLDTLARTPTFQSLQATADQRDRALASLKSATSDPARLTEAATAALHARSQLENHKLTALAADDKASAAQRDLTAAATTLESLRTRFEKQAPARPELVTFLDKLDASKTALTTAQGTAKTARAAVTQSARDLQQIQSDATRAHAELPRQQNRLLALRRDYATANRDVEEAQANLQTAQANEFRARQTQSQATQLLRQKLQQESSARPNR